jgi:Fe-S-cluster-containing hydrogenase component 2
MLEVKIRHVSKDVKMEIDKKRCVGCGNCHAVCTMGVIYLDEDEKMGRPGNGAFFRDIEEVAMVLANLKPRFKKENPVNIGDDKQGNIHQDNTDID